MKFRVKSVEVYARDPYTKEIYQYMIIGQLKSGSQFEIFDFEGFNLTDYLDQEVEGLIYGDVLTYSSNIEFERIKGEYIKNIPQDFTNKWLNYGKDFGPEYYSALKTQDGIFLINRLNPDRHTIDYDGNLIVDIPRFKLFAWHPIEE